LKDDSFWAVPFHDTSDNRLKDTLVRNVIDAITKWKVDSVVLALSHSNITKLTGPREVFSILVE
jgi:hypothetical protein